MNLGLIVSIYDEKLKCDQKVSGGACWLYGVIIENRDEVARELMSKGVDVNMVHLRSDIYKAFGGKRQNLINMNDIEEKYLYLPLNSYITEDQVEEVITIFNKTVINKFHSYFK